MTAVVAVVVGERQCKKAGWVGALSTSLQKHAVK